MTNFDDDRSSGTNIVVFTALPEEHDVFSAFFHREKSIHDDEYVIVKHIFPLNGYNLFSILAKEQGNDAAFDAIQRAKEILFPDLIVCVGIAGSLSSDLKIGDVSVSSEIVDVLQNMKISETVGKSGTQKIELGTKSYPVQSQLITPCRFMRSHPDYKQFLEKWTSQAILRRENLRLEFSEAKLDKELEIDPIVEIGAIVSGPVVASPQFKGQLKQIDRKISSIETESAGLFRACLKYSIPSITIRGISDNADQSKNAVERTSKMSLRKLAAENAVDYLQSLLKCRPVLQVAAIHSASRRNGIITFDGACGPERYIERATADLDQYLERMSPEYKHRSKGTVLPIPRLAKITIPEDIDDEETGGPISVLSALEEDRRIFVKIQKSYPNQTLAWYIGQSLLRCEIDGKQVLPLTLSGDEITPPNKGIFHSVKISENDPDICRDYFPVIIVSEPVFHSKPKIEFLVKEVEKFSEFGLIVISRAESPIEQIDSFKAKLSLAEYAAAPVPFSEIAGFLETAFEMQPREAESVATRLDDTFTKFRLHTHPSYFIGLQETTLSALIHANQRAELIQLAVDGLLSFAVIFDKSKVKLSRTTREEFLADIAYMMHCEKRSVSRSDLIEIAREFAKRKSFNLDPFDFLEPFFVVGLLNDTSGDVVFTLPYLEAYLLADRLRLDPEASLVHFDPNNEIFDYFSFDLYAERGASKEVTEQIIQYAEEALARCDKDENVFSAKQVTPRAFATTQTVIDLSKRISKAVTSIASEPSNSETRAKKQSLIDTRNKVRGRVSERDTRSRVGLPAKKIDEFSRLDALSKSSTLLATLIGSGAERLDGEQKLRIGNLIIKIFERFIHYWTINRMEADFGKLRSDLLSESSIDNIINELGLYDGDREEIVNSLSLFIDDQEVRSLSGPSGALLARLAQYAGVASLQPIVSKVEANSDVERLIRDVWMMDVNVEDGKRNLKDSLQRYKGSPLLRLVLTNHLMYRVFWHHWQSKNRHTFVDMAKYALKPLGLTTADRHTAKMLAGSKAKRQ